MQQILNATVYQNYHTFAYKCPMNVLKQSY